MIRVLWKVLATFLCVVLLDFANGGTCLFNIFKIVNYFNFKYKMKINSIYKRSPREIDVIYAIFFKCFEKSFNSENYFSLAIPAFTTPAVNPFTTNIDESAAVGTLVLTLAATDADGGMLTYSINSQSPLSKFSLENGDEIRTASTFNYETVTDRQYSFIVTV